MLYDPKRRYTVEEYFDIHNKSEVLLQYDRGFIFSKYEAPYQPDRSPTANRAIVTANLIRLLGNQLLDSPWTVYASDQRLKLANGEAFFASLSCSSENPSCDDQRDACLSRPTLVVAVEDGANWHASSSDLFDHVGDIAELRYFLIVSMNACDVILHFRDSSSLKWHSAFYQELDQQVILAGLNCKLLLKDIYAKMVLK